MTQPPKCVVSAAELRQMFNEHQFWERANSGELTTKVIRESHPSPPRARLPECTRSQLIAYFNRDGVKVALAHQYLQPDGTLGAGGRPDPKRLLMNGLLYIVVQPG